MGSNNIRTKIIATIGPGTCSEQKITALVEAGARIFRINSSHETMEVHKQRVETIRKIGKSLNIFLPIILDLQGPKIRVGILKEPIKLIDETEIKIKPTPETEEKNVIPVDYSGIISDVKKNDRLLLDDGKLELKVISTDSECITTKVIHGGLLKSRKGLNIPGATSSICAVTQRDIDYIKFAVENDIDYLALSFVRDKDDILKAKSYIKEFGGKIPVIAKIEKPQALENLDSIIMASDGIMVARGDLGIEISPEKVPMEQKRIIETTNAQRKPVIVATQMLESMIENPMPTRAEASDVANAIIDGADAVMLSGETAVGNYPTEAVGMMRLIAQNVEESNLNRCRCNLSAPKELYEMDAQAISNAIIRMIDEIEITAIIAVTKSGYTGRILSKTKPNVPIIALADEEKVCLRLNLFSGVFPYKIDFEATFSEVFLKEIDKLLIDKTFLNPGDKVIITGSIPCVATGKTNFLRIHQLGEAVTMY